MGGAPAGLYFSISPKLRYAGHEIGVTERDPPEATYGWGQLDACLECDPVSFAYAMSVRQGRRRHPDRRGTPGPAGLRHRKALVPGPPQG